MALVGYLREEEYSVSTAAIIQQFQGTQHEALLALAQADIMPWGDAFDVGAEFHGIMAKQREDDCKQQLQALDAKGLNTLDENERALYLQLTIQLSQGKILKNRV
jgi:DNA primase